MDSAMETGSTLKANSACKKAVKWDQVNIEKQKDSTQKCQTMEELQKQNLNLLDEVDGIRTKLTVLTAREVRFEAEQSTWRERERFLEAKISKYEKQKRGNGVVRESGEADVEESSAETEESIEPRREQSDRVPDETVELQNVVESLKKKLRFSKSKEQYLEKEKARLGAREMEQKMKIQRLESRVSELREKAQKDCPQRETVDKPCTREMEVQTDFTMETIDDLEAEVECLQDEFDNVTHSLQSAGLKFNKERAEWRDQRQELEERATVSEAKLKASEEGLVEREKVLEKASEDWSLQKEKSNQKECDELKEVQESLMEHLAMYRAMEQKVIVLEKERDSLEKTVALSKEESTQSSSFNDLRSKWEKASTSESSTMTETQSELGADDRQAKQQLKSNKSKDHDFEKERERFSAREKELETKIKCLESQVTELREKAREDCPQRKTADKPCTREMEVQTDVTMQTMVDMEHEMEDVQEEFKHLVQSLRSEQLNFNKDRAEWREQRQELEERATVSEAKKSMQKECDELKEPQESLKEHLVKYHAMEQKVIVLEKERDSLEKTVALLKEESTQKDEAARRQQDKASTSETPADDFDSITKQQFDKMETPRVRALVQRLRSHCGQRADALEEECDRLSKNAQELHGKLEEHERNEVRLEAEQKEFERRAVEAETQLGKAQDEAVRKEKAFQEERDMFQEMEKQLHDLQKDNADLKTTVGNLKASEEGLVEREKALEKASEGWSLEKEKSMQKECEGLKEKSLKEHLVKYRAMEQKVIVLEKERDSLEKTVALLKEESTQKDEAARRQQDKASTSETPAGDFDSITKQQFDKMETPRVRALVQRLRSHCGQRADAFEEECERLRENVQTLSRKLEEHERNEVRLEAERKESERRAVEAETQLGKAQDDAVRKEKVFQEERDMFQEMEKQLHELQKDNADLKTTVGNLKEQRRVLEVLETSGANEALVSELRRQLQNEVTLRESLHRFQWEREKQLMAQQERLEHEKEQWVKRVNESSEEKTRILAMFQDEREKTKRLEEKAEETSLKRGQMMQEHRDELRRRDQEKVETERRYEQELECLRQREVEDLDLISELTETLETKLKEAREENKEHTAREEQWKEAKEKLLSQIELLRATNDFNQRKKERKGFFSRVFGRSN